MPTIEVCSSVANTSVPPFPEWTEKLSAAKDARMLALFSGEDVQDLSQDPKNAK